MLTLEPGVLDGLRPALQARGVNAERAVSVEALREALAGRYRVVGELGRGAYGVVFLAYEEALERPVALKVLPPCFAAQRETRARFLREARTAAKLSHPHIVPIHSVEETDDWVFFTMDYVDGETLGQWVLTHGPLPVGEATLVLHDVAQAVGYAHARGVIHRDLKADNILMERGTGRVLVMDFGIARVEGQPDVIREGYVAGTAAFMSPEVVRGGQADERSDVYALGITGFFAVTGYVPFDGETLDDIFAQHLLAPAPALAVRGEHLDLTYSRAVGRCLEKDPDRRFATADLLADELARAPELRRRDLPVPLHAFAERVRRHAESNRGLSVLVAVALMFLVSGIWLSDWVGVALAAGFLGLVVASTGLALVPTLRRVLREENYAHADIVHALSVDLERQREVRAFELGNVSLRPARIARQVAFGGLGVVGLAAAWSIAGLDATVGLGAMYGGVLVAMTAGVIGFFHTRRRRNVAGEWWLKFWRSRAGEWVVRLASFRLESRPAPESAPPEVPMPAPPSLKPVPAETPPELLRQVPAMRKLAASRIQRLNHWVHGTNTFETGERPQVAVPPDDVRRRLKESHEELQRLRYRLAAARPGESAERLAADFEALRRLCDLVDGLLGGPGGEGGEADPPS